MVARNVISSGLDGPRVVCASLGLLLSVACSLCGCSHEAVGEKGTVGTSEVVATPSGLLCEAPVWDIGEVLVEGRTVDFQNTFCLRNRSTEPITIRDVRSDCGCLVAKDYARTVQPGAEIELKATMSVAGPPGKFRKTIVVFTESGSSEKLPLVVVGKRAVSSYLYATPLEMNFGEIVQGEAKTKQLMLVRYDGSAVNYRNIVSESPALSLGGEPKEVDKIDFWGNRFRCLELSIKTDTKSLPVGSFRSRLTIQTKSTDESTNELIVPLKAEVCEAKTPWVKSVLINRLGPGENAEVSIVNSVWSEAFPEIISMSYEGDDAVQLADVPVGSKGESMVTPHIKVSRRLEPRPPGVARGSLTLKVRAATGESVVKIDIVVFLSE